MQQTILELARQTPMSCLPPSTESQQTGEHLGGSITGD
jgi:hypothetical protein